MARIRTIKPTYFTSPTVVKLSFGARLTFAGIWTYCDDEGRARYNPRLIKAALWPLEDDVTHEMVDAWCREIVAAGPMIIYEIDGERFLAVRSWKEHQKINKPTKSVIPPPPAEAWSTPVELRESYREEGNKEGNEEKELGTIVSQVETLGADGGAAALEGAAPPARSLVQRVTAMLGTGAKLKRHPAPLIPEPPPADRIRYAGAPDPEPAR